MKSILRIFFLLGVATCINSLHPNVGLNIYRLIKRHGYDFELHHTNTEDGYILELQRIKFRNKKPNTGLPMILFHGMTSTSAAFVTHLEKHKNIAYILLNKGYDVWLGNARGTTHSRKHINLDPEEDAKQFFDFSWHEIGYYDIPAMINHILPITGYSQVGYIGHSQGGTSFFVMAAERPEYNQKIKIAFSFGGFATAYNFPQSWRISPAKYENDIKKYLDRLEIYEFLQFSPSIRDLVKIFCDKSSTTWQLCIRGMDFLTGYDATQMDVDMLPVLASTAPAGISVNQIIHYLQVIKHKHFAKFDYHNETIHLKKYGSTNPPQYDLSKITCPVILYAGLNDAFIDAKDAYHMTSLMPNASIHVIDYPQFTHLDFLWAKDIDKFVYDDLMYNLNKA